MAETPNQSELILLKALWRQGPSSAREVQDGVGASTGWSPSTTRTMLERMREKGLVDRQSVHGMAVYRAAHEKVGLLSRIIKDVASRVLEIDGPLPVSAFAKSKLLSTDELSELEALLVSDGDEAGEDGPDEGREGQVDESAGNHEGKA